jgi:hypothetical protein
VRSFKVFAQLAEYTVKFPKRKTGIFDPAVNDGLCDFDNRTIYIKGTLPADCLVTTFWHEYMHAVTSELNLDELTYNEPLIETMSQNIARTSRALPEELK